ncbi:MAG: crossover junction endodeoxyribonuclease RuvC [Deltaproteobacteria bacterium]|nr:MAG: crossover junction endodeoxyribonuclease RuvC [Deltaproteobacteria bacterium]
MGIDPGSNRTGYGVLEVRNDRPALVVAGVIDAGRKGLADRLVKIFNGLTAVIEKFQPKVIALEEVFHARNARSALVLGHARGIVLLAAGLAGVPVCEYSPARVKRTVSGDGKADKKQISKMLGFWLGSAPSQPDASDAVAVALCHIHWAGESNNHRNDQ